MPVTISSAGRNELCPCGSGKKYKRCCGNVDLAAEDTASRFFGVAVVLAGVMAVGGAFVFARAYFVEETGKKVWSAEHGHYHTVGGGEHASSEGGPGKVWSEEHGHWHEAGKPEPPVAASKPVTGALEGLRSSELDAAGKKVAEPGQ
jgi:hypothetical protein